MRLISWNCQGLGPSLTRKALRNSDELGGIGGCGWSESSWIRERRSETLTEGAWRILRRAEEVDLKLRKESTAAKAGMVRKTAPSKERASWEIREARVCSFDDIAVVVSTCGDESAGGLEVTAGGD